MNVANLQIEGLMMAVATVNRLLVERGIVSQEELDAALRKAQAALTGDERMSEDLTRSNRDAVCFPVRLLRHANASQDDGALPAFQQLAKLVGETKRPFGDQQ